MIASSLLGFASLVGTFVLAAVVVGSPAPLSQLLPLCTVGLAAMAVPVKVGGWGPREVATAAAFAAAGLGAPPGSGRRGALRGGAALGGAAARPVQPPIPQVAVAPRPLRGRTGR